MEDMTFPMKDTVTNTMLDLDTLRQMKSWESQNAHTQMCIVCNNAGIVQVDYYILSYC